MNDLVVQKPAGQLVSGGKLEFRPISALELVSAAKQIGAMLYNAKRFGFNTQQDAESHALICLMTNQDPMAVIAETDSWHFISGTRQMKYRAMANRFLRTGGKIDPIERTPDSAKALLSRNGVNLQVQFSWEEAAKEPYVWRREAKINGGKLECFIDGQLNEKALKDNWSTPRRRMQMLWARLITDAIASTWADVIGGAYVVNEMQEDDYDDEMLEGEVVETAKPKQLANVPAVIENVTAVNCEVVNTANPLATQSPVPELQVTAVEEVPERPDPCGPITPETIEEIKTLREQIGLPTDAWKQLIGMFGVASALHLTQEQAEQLQGTLMQRWELKKLEDDATSFSFTKEESAGPTA